MRQNKSWEDQLSAIYTQMTGSKVDFAKEKAKARRREQDYKDRKYADRCEDIVVPLKNMPDNRNTPGYAIMTVCYVMAAVMPIGFQPNPKRLDAPCEMCVNFQCPYAQGVLDNDRVMQYSDGKMKVQSGRAVMVTSSSYAHSM